MSSATQIPTPTVSLANSAVSVVFDSTYGLHTGTPSTTVVGGLRGKFANQRICGVVQSTTQNVTIRLDYLSAAGTWITSASTQAVTAATAQPFDWLPVAADWRVVIVNGGTGPSALTLDGIQLVRGDRASGS